MFLNTTFPLFFNFWIKHCKFSKSTGQRILVVWILCVLPLLFFGKHRNVFVHTIIYTSMDTIRVAFSEAEWAWLNFCGLGKSDEVYCVNEFINFGFFQCVRALDQWQYILNLNLQSIGKLHSIANKFKHHSIIYKLNY